MNLGIFLSILAGLSTLIGSFTIFFINNKAKKIIIFTLAFAAGIMSFISFLQLIPESYKILISYYNQIPIILNIIIFIIIGIVFSLMIDKILPVDLENKCYNQDLYRIGIFSMIAIIIHNILEGMTTFIAINSNLQLGISITISIILHNIPEGISVAFPIYYATNSKKKAMKYVLISALSEPLGAILSYLIFGTSFNELIMGYLFPIISGIMIYISFHELLPESFKYKNIKLSIIAFLIGILTAIFNIFFF